MDRLIFSKIVNFSLYDEFLDKLNEATRANTHQTHFEDLVMLGRDGIDELNDKIEGFLSSMKGDDIGMNFTTKIDGSPAVICWSKFEGYPDNSICLKSFIGGAQNSMSSVDDIMVKYSDRPEMAEKLKYSLVLAERIPENEAWQGDCLFTDMDKHEENINGTDYITFQPNKIVYAFSEDNPGYNKVKDAKFGIAYHTIYKAGENGEKKQSFHVDPELLNAPDEFYILSPALDYQSDYFDLNDVREKFEVLKKYEDNLLVDDSYENLVSNEVFMSYWNTFENANIADKRQITLNINTFFDDLKDYVAEKQTGEWTKKLLKLKTRQGRLSTTDKWLDSLEELRNLIDENRETLVMMVKVFNLAAEIKMDMWEGFKQIKSGYSMFYKSRTKGVIPAEMEGVAMSDSDGNIVKIVDRSTFSANNRDDDIMAGWEHNKMKENRLFENEDGNTIVVAFGRLNPPTIGHLKLVDKMADTAEGTGNRARLYLSHSVDKKNEFRNPLPYDLKLTFVGEAFGNKVDVQESDAKTLLEVFHELYEEGFDRVIYIGGNDRIGGEEDMTAIAEKYNGYKNAPDKKYYEFEEIKFVSAGERDKSSDDLASRASASLARKYVVEDDLESFIEISPLSSNSASQLFAILYAIADEQGKLS